MKVPDDKAGCTCPGPGSGQGRKRSVFDRVLRRNRTNKVNTYYKGDLFEYIVGYTSDNILAD